MKKILTIVIGLLFFSGFLMFELQVKAQGDVFEPDNSFTEYSNMTVITSLQNQSRSIDPAGDNDYILFYAYSGNKYVFYTESSIDTCGYLYNSSQYGLASDDDSGTGLNFRIEYIITSSDYYFLQVRGFSSSTQGPYTLYYYYEYVGGDVFEPDNSFSQYSTMTVSTSLQNQSRSIDPAGDNDYILFYAYSGNRYVFYTESSIDTCGYLYDSSQYQLTYDDDSGTDQNFRIEYTITTTGYYFLQVQGYYSSTQGPYTLYYYYESVEDVFEPDNSFSQYSTMTVSTSLQSQSRSIEPAGDDDYIRFYAYGGNTYVLYTESSIDTYGYLYDSSQNELTSDDDSGTDQNFRIEYTITTTGYYFLQVQGYLSSTQGPYTLYYYYFESDTTPPTVSVTIDPSSPDTTEIVTFTVVADDNAGGSGIANVTLYIDDDPVQTWTTAGTHIYIGGPYSRGIHTYYVEAFDNANNKEREPAFGHEEFTVSAKPTIRWQVLAITLAIFVLAIIVPGIVIAVLMTKRKKQS